ncbi:hypothetical protein BDV41DRAFT_526600 [Aspergillus transmontanensis]|uniref:Uncharacterized protein n=1 Tax=Aspergillus transmontanensis TaxID=1034304 RepID=A0A5N6W9K2_9EURO|nr:hypothetical protein BDV41DRAFT_526600 [Aspergillus transmontanensis]
MIRIRASILGRTSFRSPPPAPLADWHQLFLVMQGLSSIYPHTNQRSQPPLSVKSFSPSVNYQQSQL